MIRAVYDMVRAFLRKLRQDTVSAFAAQTAFFVILSFFPFVIFLLTLLNYLPIPLEEILRVIGDFLPGTVQDFVAPLLAEGFSKTTKALLSFSVIAALWSSSRGFLVIIRGLNAVYGNRETRNYFVVRALSVFYTLIFAMVLILTLLLLVFGNQIYLQIQSRVPVLEYAAFLIISLRTVVFLLALTAYFLLLYTVIPNRKSRVFDELPGALLSAVGWLGFSYLYSFYIDNLSNFSAMYGSLTAIVLCMIWLYACMYIMFIGAELNVVVSDAAVQKAWQAFRYSLKRKRRAE
ncbi:MAG: YihY/virulence factor BrkB family protein [Lachnospiraceae bacterium]|nr:YihY/virulence factor BrkB family protein [Lachnospiraceae bacterium]